MPHSCTKTGIVRTQRLLGPNDQATQEMNAVSSWMTVVVNMTSNIVSRDAGENTNLGEAWPEQVRSFNWTGVM